MATLSACNRAVEFQSVNGKLHVSPSASDSVANITVNSDASRISVDFGEVPVGQHRDTALQLSNVGTVDMTILKIVQDTAFAEFSVDVAQGQVLVAGGAPTTIPAHYVALAAGPQAARITLTTDSTVTPTVEIALAATGIEGNLAVVPAMIDFGNVVVNTTATQSVAVTNNAGSDLLITVGEMKGSDPLLFTTTPTPGMVETLQSGETRSLTISYTPLVASPIQSQAYLALSLCGTGAGCASLVSLRGTAVATGLTVSPSTLDFGFVALGSTVSGFVTLCDVANLPIHLTADPAVWNLSGAGLPVSAGPFQPGAGFPAKDSAVLPQQCLEIPVVFSPASLDRFAGEIQVATDDSTNVNLVIPLAGFGGGAVIRCSPQALDFGRNAVVGGVGIASTLTVQCTNVGQDVPGHPEANLFIPDPSSSDPGLSIQNGNTAFQAVFDPSFPAAGLAAGESVQIDVTYTPAVAGTDSDTLIISSNDSQHPRTPVSLTGTAEVLPPCNFTINPTQGLAFGHVDEGSEAVLPFEIVNNGTDACLVSALRVLSVGGAGAAQVFTLPDFPAAAAPSDVTIPAGQSLEVAVRFAPTTAQTAFSGSISFTISNPQDPNQVVSLTGSSLGGCLLILPNPVDFGVVGFDPVSGHWCKSAARTIAIRNLCDAQDVNVNSISVVDLASNNGTSQPEFILGGDPSPVTVPKACGTYYCPNAGPVTFQVSFAPYLAGKHMGGVKIQADDLADPYLISLQGDADANPVQTENFTGHHAAIDVLWVLDTDDDTNASQALAANMAGFLAYPLQNNIDFQMATTSTDVYATATSEDGSIEPCPHCKLTGSAPRVVRSNEGLDAAGALGTLLSLGSGVNCYTNCNGFGSDEQLFEAAYEALSPPLLTGYNQSFYRSDAFLAVIVVNSDPEDDRSETRSFAFYYNAFVGLKGARNANRFSLSYVCNGVGIDNGQKISQMVELTGGVEADLSNTGTPNWTDQLNALWPQVATQMLEYRLAGTPVTVPMTITVTDNGIAIPQLVNGFPQWTYDATNNAVQFDPLAFPQPGDQVQISYTLACNN